MARAALTPGRDEIAALADLRRLASAVQAGGTPVAATIEHWELTDIADHFEKILREISAITTPEADAAWKRMDNATSEAELDAAVEEWCDAHDESIATITSKRLGGTA